MIFIVIYKVIYFFVYLKLNCIKYFLINKILRVKITLEKLTNDI